MEPEGKYLITGCGHSGTGWVAKVMNLLAGPCGHEDVYNQFTTEAKLPRRWSRAVGESSWLAVPWIRDMPNRRPILHVTRHPLDVLSSVHTSNVLAATCDCGHAPGAHLETPHSKYIQRWRSDVFQADTDIDRAIAWIVIWNQWIDAEAARVERPFLRVKVESLTHHTDILVYTANRLSGRTIDSSEAEEAVRQTSPQHNSHRRGDVKWDDIPESVWKTNLRALTSRYGYEE